MNRFILHFNPVQKEPADTSTSLERVAQRDAGLDRARDFLAHWEAKEISTWIYEFEMDVDLTTFTELLRPYFEWGLEFYVISWEQGEPVVCGHGDGFWQKSHWIYGSKVLRAVLTPGEFKKIDMAFNAGPIPACWESEFKGAC